MAKAGWASFQDLEWLECQVSYSPPHALLNWPHLSVLLLLSWVSAGTHSLCRRSTRHADTR